MNVAFLILTGDVAIAMETFLHVRQPMIHLSETRVHVLLTQSNQLPCSLWPEENHHSQENKVAGKDLGY
jgi:hypothetical protein